MRTNYHSVVNFEGRNGMYKQKGIEIQKFSDRVSLFPITGKGEVGRGMMEIPLDDLASVIWVLETVRSQMISETAVKHIEHWNMGRKQI